MTADEARERFSAAFEHELDAEQQRAFDAALEKDPVLAREYEAFVGLLELTHAAGAGAKAAARPRLAEPEEPVPDLLPGVQRRLRARSRGRFYADRFSERRRSGRLQPLTLALMMLALLSLAWLAMLALRAVALAS